MSISPIIDERYRLRPEDVGRSGIYVTVQNVSWQGVEQLHPLLHLREFPQKRLLLTQQQVESLIEITSSSLADEWIGQRLVLVATYDDGEPVIMIRLAPLAKGAPIGWRLPLHLEETGRTHLLLLLLALIFLLVFLLDR